MWLHDLPLPALTPDLPRTLPLHDDAGRPVRWAVLLGESGAGKTRVLEAITAAHQDGAISPKLFLAAFGCSRAQSASSGRISDPLSMLLPHRTLPPGALTPQPLVESALQGFASRPRIRPGGGFVAFQAMVRAIAGVTRARGSRGLVLIDEIELHLSVLQQRHVGALLTGLFPRVQFIVTTHSPVIAHETRAGQLLRLTCERRRIRIERLTVDASRLSLPQLLESPLFGLPSMASHHSGGRIPESREPAAQRRDALLGRIERHLARRTG